MSEPESEGNLSDEDTENVIGELRCVLKSAAEKNPVDHQLVMDLTKTLESLTEMRIGKAKGWDPRLGGAIKKIEEAETKLGILRGRKKKKVIKTTKKSLIRRVMFWKDEGK